MLVKRRTAFRKHLANLEILQEAGISKLKPLSEVPDTGEDGGECSHYGFMLVDGELVLARGM